jgi:hypothetical protein
VSARIRNLSSIAVLLASCGTLSVTGCTAESAARLGSVTLALTSFGITIDRVHWKIQTSANPPVVLNSGDIDASGMSASSSTEASVIAGTAYVVLLTADIVPATGNGFFCVGESTPFDVVAGEQVGVNVSLVCGSSPKATAAGSAIVDGKVSSGDNCPVLTSWEASPLQTGAPKGTITFTATAGDADRGETLTYAWTATAGTFATPSSAGVASGATNTAVYTCGSPGTQTVTVTVTDDHAVHDPNSESCSTSMAFPISCA